MATHRYRSRDITGEETLFIRKLWPRPMILIIFALIHTNRQACQGRNVRQNRVHRAGFVA
jgi:hypothetical protein